MPVEEITEALQALDTEALRRVADQAGVTERTLWRYRAGESAPTPARARLIAQALALAPRGEDRDVSTDQE